MRKLWKNCKSWTQFCKICYRRIYKIDNDNKYSYKCLYTNLSVSAQEGNKKASLYIILKNNGNLNWTEQTTLLNVKDSLINACHIQLKPLKPNENDIFEITFENLENLPVRTYTSILLFSVNGKIYGEPIKTEINILKKEC